MVRELAVLFKFGSLARTQRNERFGPAGHTGGIYDSLESRPKVCFGAPIVGNDVRYLAGRFTCVPRKWLQSEPWHNRPLVCSPQQAGQRSQSRRARETVPPASVGQSVSTPTSWPVEKYNSPSPHRDLHDRQAAAVVIVRVLLAAARQLASL